MYKIKKKRLIINNQYKVDFWNPISQVSENDDKYLVRLLLDGKSDKDYHRNVYLVDERGEILWQIEAFNMGGAWTSIAMGNGYVTTVNSRGFYCEIDIKTGKVIDAKFTK